MTCFTVRAVVTAGGRHRAHRELLPCLVLFWTQFTPPARVLVIAVALVVEVFAALQYRAAGPAKSRTLEAA
jgi:hypothetical protein